MQDRSINSAVRYTDFLYVTWGPNTEVDVGPRAEWGDRKSRLVTVLLMKDVPVSDIISNLHEQTTSKLCQPLNRTVHQGANYKKILRLSYDVIIT